MSGSVVDTVESGCPDAASAACRASGSGASSADEPQPTLLLTGCAVSTGNLGVSALGVASIKGVLDALPAARIVLQDWSGPPSLAVRDRLKETKADEILLRCGAMSRETMARRHGLEPEKERALLKQERSNGPIALDSDPNEV